MNENEKDIKQPNEKKPKNKGFYVAIALSLVMVATACVFAARDGGNKKIEKPESVEQISVTTTSFVAVQKPQTSVPKKTTVVKNTVVTTQSATTTQKTVTVAQTEKPVIAETPSKYLPVSGDVLNAFSNGELVKSKTTGAWQTHNGTDFLADTGENVVAITNGTVTEINKDALWGVVVTIEHGEGIIAKYCGLNENVTCEVGEEIEGGSEIGTIGTTSDIESLEPTHLHLEVTENGRFADPLYFINN
jgi:murein DD-endopeptidase MepM/ murein hydrolase activator NlpD